MSSFKGKERFRGVWMNIKDTAFLLKVLSKVEVKIEDAKQAENTINKIKHYHERLLENEVNPIID